MTTYTTTRAELLFVDVPEGAKNIRLSFHKNLLEYDYKDVTDESFDIELPPGPWTLHPEVTEEVARELVDEDVFHESDSDFCRGDSWTVYKNYITDRFESILALESLQSLRTKLNINPSAVLLSKPLNNK